MKETDKKTKDADAVSSTDLLACDRCGYGAKEIEITTLCNVIKCFECGRQTHPYLVMGVAREAWNSRRDLRA